MFHFYINTCLESFNIASLYSCGIIIFSTGFCFTILLSHDLGSASVVLFPINSPDKNPYLLTYCLVLGSTKYCHIAKLEVRVVSIY